MVTEIQHKIAPGPTAGGQPQSDTGQFWRHDPPACGRIILLMGAPGCGKGTQSSILESQFGMASVSTGAMLREAAKRNTPAGSRLRRIMASGGLVDDAIVCEAVASHIRAFMSSPGRAGGNGSGQDLILDGFPRTVAQARCLDHLLADLGCSGPMVFHLDVPNDVLMRRLARRRQCAKCGAIYNLSSDKSIADGLCRIDGGALVERDDDSEGIVERRLVAYEAETLPVIDYYRGRNDRAGIYRRIDGNRGAAEIAKEVGEIVLLADVAVAA